MATFAGRSASTVLAVLLVLSPFAGAGAAELYRARTIVTGQGEESRAAGFALCLQEVLVKVSGDPRLAADPRAGALAAEAAAFVSAFRYRDRMEGIPVHDEQGTRDRPHDLTVDFDPARIDAALRDLGREPWTAPRPPLMLLVAVRNADTAFVLTADGARGRDMREALAAAGDRFGLDLALPDEAAIAAAGLDATALAAADPAALADIADPAFVLVGSLDWSPEALGWIAGWRLQAKGATHRWTIRGVSFDEAFRSAAGGGALILSGNGTPQ